MEIKTLEDAIPAFPEEYSVANRIAENVLLSLNVTERSGTISKIEIELFGILLAVSQEEDYDNETNVFVLKMFFGIYYNFLEKVFSRGTLKQIRYIF